MKRWLTHGIIAGYLSVLGWGVFSHTLGYKTGAHPAMYYIVWDMFCGWASYSSRMHVIGEGESGTYYELAPGPWGAFHPYGNLARHHYDSNGGFAIRQAMNCLKHTKHEPMVRLYSVEECWPKKYNLRDSVWNRMFDVPKDRPSYYQMRATANPQGELVQLGQPWLSVQNVMVITDNPRLYHDSHKGRPFFTHNLRQHAVRGYGSGNAAEPLLQSPAAH